MINCSNLKIGGGIQVADSICCSLSNYNTHEFFIVLPNQMQHTKERIDNKFANIHIYTYNICNSFKTLLFGHDVFLDNVVHTKNIDIVLTVFGPSRWKPKCKHLCGFASAQLVLSDSPYYGDSLPLKFRIKEYLRISILKYFYRKCGPNYYTENPYITNMVAQLFKGSNVYTVTNYYNQVFDDKSLWKNKQLPFFDGITLLTVTAAYPHKNLKISLDIAKYIKRNYPDFNVRFVFTIDKQQFVPIPKEYETNFLFIGKVDITECPSLYEQADIMFQPTLLECFTATYPEAMKMERPIITSDLDFALGLCGEAAVYYSPLSPEDAAEKIVYVARHKDVQEQLIEAGKKQLLKYDTYTQRTDKLIHLLETI